MSTVEAPVMVTVDLPAQLRDVLNGLTIGGMEYDSTSQAATDTVEGWASVVQVLLDLAGEAPTGATREVLDCAAAAVERLVLLQRIRNGERPPTSGAPKASVVARWNGEDEQWWVVDCEAEDYSPDGSVFHALVPRHIRAAEREAWDRWCGAHELLIQEMGLGLDTGTRLEVCPTWTGQVYPPATTCHLQVLDNSYVGVATSADAAAAKVAELPESFMVMVFGRGLVEVHRTDVKVEKVTRPGWSGPCTTCGHDRTKHQTDEAAS